MISCLSEEGILLLIKEQIRRNINKIEKSKALNAPHKKITNMIVGVCHFRKNSAKERKIKVHQHEIDITDPEYCSNRTAVLESLSQAVECDVCGRIITWEDILDDNKWEDQPSTSSSVGECEGDHIFVLCESEKHQEFKSKGQVGRNQNKWKGSKESKKKHR